jgi:rod shape-determining protein MreB
MVATSKKSKNLCFVGIDLGTSRSVISSSNGTCEWVESYVGWPKDFVAKKMLGKNVLIGAEALEHRHSLQLSRPLANGVFKDGTEQDSKAVKELVAHLLTLSGAEEGDTIHIAVGVPAEALKINKKAIRETVGAYADSLIVVSEPFSVAYGLGTLDNTLIVDIGAGTVDFCIMHGTIPNDEDQRSLTTAGDYIDEQLLELLKEAHPEAKLSLNMVRKFKEEHGFVGKARKKVMVKVPVEGKFTSINISNELKIACESILPPIIETIISLISGFDPEYQERIRQNIVLAGGGSQLEGLDEYLTEAMKDFESCKFRCIEDPLCAGAIGAMELVTDMPEELLEALRNEEAPR